jgi:hypothetical protein
LYWLSRRGIEKMSSKGIDRVSDGNKNILDILISNTAQARTKLYTTQAHWEAGNLAVSGPGALMSATISPGSIVPSTWTGIDTSSSNWVLGTMTNITTNYYEQGTIELGVEESTSIYDDFSDNNYTTGHLWISSGTNHYSASSGYLYFYNTAVAPSGQTETNLIYSTKSYSFLASTMTFYDYVTASMVGSYVGLADITQEIFFAADSSATANMNAYSLIINLRASKTKISSFPEIYTLTCPVSVAYLYKYSNGVSTLLDTQSLSASGAGINQNTCSLNLNYISISVSTLGVISAKSDGTNVLNMDYTDVNEIFFSSTVVMRNTTYLVGTTPSADSKVDNIYFSSSGYYSSGTFISRVFDTYLSTPIGGPFSFTESVPIGSSIAYSVRQATANDVNVMGSWNLVSTTTSGAYRIPFTQRHWQYKSYFTTDYSTQTPSIQDVTIQAATTAEYIHQCAQIDEITSWGNFQANSILAGDTSAITYYVSTGTSCDEVQRSTATWNTQLNNAPIIVSTSAYMGVKELFTIASASDTSLLRDVTINWLSGTARPPVASGIYLDRYYMAYTTSTSSGVNDFMWVIDKNDATTFLTGINCYSLSLFNRKFYCGDASATGKIYQLETGETDNGNSYTSSIRTKAFSFGDSDAEKEYVKMYASFAPETDSILDIDITPSYHLDLSTTAITLNPVNTGEDSTAGILVSKIPFKLDSNVTGRYIDIEFSNSGTSQPWTMFGLSIYYKKYEVK